MSKTILALGAAAVALSAVPAQADRGHHYGRPMVCANWRHHHCVRWMNRGYHLSMARRAYRVGYRFGPDYSYTEYSALPPVYVQRYDLTPRYRYVYSDNRIYVVDPTTYAVTRVLDALTR